VVWIGAGAGVLFNGVYSNRLKYPKFAILLMMIGAGMIILAFVHFIYLTIIIIIGIAYVSFVYYRREIKPILKEKETENL
jgi:hypothetical protein